MNECYSAPESERAVIGAILKGVLDIDAVGLQQGDFTRVETSELFGALAALHAQGKPTDIVALESVRQELTVSAAEMASMSPIISAPEGDKYIAMIREASMRRALSKIAQQAAELSRASDMTPTDAIEDVRGKLDDLLRQGPSVDTETLSQAIVRLNHWLFEDKTDDTIKTGIPSLDAVLGGGIRGSKLTIIGARPSIGKSALGLMIAENAAQQGKKVLMVSLEMDVQEIYARILARYSGVDVARIEARTFTDQESQDIIASYQIMDPMQITFATLQTPAQVRACAMRQKITTGVDMILVDYLQLMQSGRKTSSRYEEVGQISRELKLLAMELGVPVIAMSQMNRDSEHGSPRMPSMSESRESGSIEQDANQYLILHRPERDEVESKYPAYLTAFDTSEGSDRCLLIVNVAKNRNGKTGAVPVLFDAAHMQFYSIVQG